MSSLCVRATTQCWAWEVRVFRIFIFLLFLWLQVLLFVCMRRVGVKGGLEGPRYHGFLKHCDRIYVICVYSLILGTIILLFKIFNFV